MKYSTQHDFQTNIKHFINSNDLETALAQIRDLASEVIDHGSFIKTVFGSPLLDQLCQEIGAKSLKKYSPDFSSTSTDSETVIYLATELATFGGHSAVLEDFIRFQPNKKHIILMTDLFDKADIPSIKERYKQLPVTIEVAPKESLTARLSWLQKRIIEIRADKTFIFNHYQDAVIIAAIQPQLPTRFFFYHHCDHTFCLGLYLNFVTHIDLHNLSYHTCRNSLGIKNNIYWPLVIKDRGKLNKNFTANKPLVTCSSGSINKFSSDYLYSYEKLLPQILATTKGKHVHIGHLSETTLNTIKNGLINQRIDPDCFIWVPWVESLWLAMDQWQVDLYIASFPYGGGRASIEVMGSQTPLITHENYHSPFLGGGFMVYPEALCWKNPQELLEFLSKLTPEMLTQQAQLARNYYEQYYQPQQFIEEINSIDYKGLLPPPLTKKQLQPDELQTGIKQINLYQKILNDREYDIRILPFKVLINKILRRYLRKLLRKNKPSTLPP